MELTGIFEQLFLRTTVASFIGCVSSGGVELRLFGMSGLLRLLGLLSGLLPRNLLWGLGITAVVYADSRVLI
ncbi:hypothetical protein ABG82_09525 [Mycobacteroides immunogenum]|uniref:Uncharacterized protein n=1 Tax=Mycobacteroides immunogenum TaxID=83262 RepID=A0A7V8LKX4_9MYCO|nr:hypothetical protein ABG82_09525 [Mycobacteroides immunogenum]ANO03602.1 hypothetical protein BAB75_09585 [Mycobacteroides immunogenum]KIU38522.1 hypothetical protein TL11_22085 [Mycobacteroides immunogenum]KPG04268.1 hypothetical protein AN909_23660 [Mycobacteroides immunogenum]KPG04816.1 hypothetical protein AN908_23555 [Mycobacteroides immunogenum]